MERITITETGCYLDNHRGHYIDARRNPACARSTASSSARSSKWAIDTYDEHWRRRGLPARGHDRALSTRLSNGSTAGRTSATTCDQGPEATPTCPGHECVARRDMGVVRCKKCTGTGRGPRIDGPELPAEECPKGCSWAFEDW